MGALLFAREYLAWHYGEAFVGMGKLTWALLRFWHNFFSIPLLLRTLISPWYRLREQYDRNWTHFEALGAALLGNIVLRIVGFVLRATLILFGVAFEVCTLVLMGALFFIWIFAPLVIFALIVNAIATFR